MHAALPAAYPFLLESTQTNAQTGRYSLLLAECSAQRQFHCHSAVELKRMFAALPARASAPGGGPPAADGELPFVGGWFVYLGYELALQLQPHLSAPAQSPAGQAGLPMATAVYCGGAIIVDHLRDQTWLVSEAGDCDAHARVLAQCADRLPQPTRLRFSSEDGAIYQQAVARAVAYIQAGDIYQANLSRRWQGGPLARERMPGAYAQLRAHNPGSFSASIQLPYLALASASPERLFCVSQGRIQTRPIAGTRPRGETPAQDQALIAELLAHPKEQAEHIMLVDLERHDVGRVCQPGSVQVSELLGIESYASVHHIVSNIVGRLRDDVSLRELFSAVFPGGTITGCPKIRCMQIITELEQRPRGPYTGSVGYLSNCGRMDFNILIRTLVWQQGRVHFDAGAGIVADSEAAAELAETEAKAAGLMRALSA